MISQPDQAGQQERQEAVATQTVIKDRIHVPVWAITLGMLVVLAVIFWGVLGIRTTGLIEDWTIYQKFDSVGITRNSLLLTETPDRPFLLLFWAFGYILTPDSFIGLQILAMIIFIGTGLTLFAVVRRLLPDKPSIAFMAAVLAVIYPADTGLFNTRYGAFQLDLFFYLIAIYLLIAHWQSPHWSRLIGMWCALLLCLGMVETAYPLVAATPLILVWLHKGLSRRMFRVAGLWYLPLIGMALVTIYALTTANTLVSKLKDADTQPLITRLIQYAGYSILPYGRVFIQGWTDLIHQFRVGALDFITPALVFAFVVAILGMVAVWFLAKRTATTIPTSSLPARRSRVYSVLYSHRASLALFGIGIVVIGLGFLPYIVVPSIRTSTDRAYLFSAIGGALCLSVIVYEIGCVIPRVPAMLLFGGLLWLATANGLGRVVGLRYDSSQEQLMLSELARQMPQIPTGASIVVFDESVALSGHFWRFGFSNTNGYFQAAVSYLYHRPDLNVGLCYPPEVIWGEPLVQCSIDPDGLTLTSPGLYTETIPYNRLVAFEYEPQDGLTLLPTWPTAYQTAQNQIAASGYNPTKMIDAHALPPARVYTLLSSWPYVPFELHPVFASRSMRINWGEVNKYPIELFQDPMITNSWSGDWTIAKTASANIWLAPDSSYQLQMHVKSSLLPEILNSLTLSVNNQPIPLTQTPDSSGAVIFTGTLPQTVVALDPTSTFLEFHIDKVVSPKSLGTNNDRRLFGVRIDWMQIDPINSTLAGS